jgi:predicted metal-dependent peptidase
MNTISSPHLAAEACEARFKKARTALLLDHPFFGTLLFRLAAKPRRSIKTMATDGVSLYYNPEFVNTLTAAELQGTLAHEVMHPALQHHARRNDRDARRWNMACDYAINPLLMDAGLTLPKDVLVDGRFAGMSAEEIYNRLDPENEGCPDDKSQQNTSADAKSGDSAKRNEGGEGVSDDPTAPESPGGIGQVLDAPEEVGSPSVDEQAREWQIAVQQAENVARLAGKMPVGAKRSLEAAREASVNWRELLRRAWSETIPADYGWARPNRRHIWAGLYLPGVTSEGFGEIAIAVDCSGSINARQLGLFEAEIQSILAGQRPRRVHVLYFDAVVHRTDTYECGQPIQLSAVGGGGTDFRPCFDWIEEHGAVPQTLVFLTDLCGTFPTAAPNYPVIWAATGKSAAPFGEVVPMGAA